MKLKTLLGKFRYIEICPMNGYIYRLAYNDDNTKTLAITNVTTGEVEFTITDSESFVILSIENSYNAVHSNYGPKIMCAKYSGSSMEVNAYCYNTATKKLKVRKRWT